MRHTQFLAAICNEFLEIQGLSHLSRNITCLQATTGELEATVNATDI